MHEGKRKRSTIVTRTDHQNDLLALAAHPRSGILLVAVAVYVQSRR
jgi:hypothetical protein